LKKVLFDDIFFIVLLWGNNNIRTLLFTIS
jgi:hypothetical protein